MATGLIQPAMEGLGHHWQPDIKVNVDEFLNRDTGDVVWSKVPEELLAEEEVFTDPAVREMELVLCARDPARFITSWCLTFDPHDELDPVKPFPNWMYLGRVMEEYRRGGNLLIEKSRQLLLSWVLALLFLWEMTFNPGFSALMISWKVEKTDDGGEKSTPESLFGKVRWAWMLLPKWMQANLFFKYRRIQHLEHTNRWITAETAGARGGRGGAYRRVLLDEADHIIGAHALFQAVKLACPGGIILNSTPAGKQGIMWQIRTNPLTQFRRITIPWTLHPFRAAKCLCCGEKVSLTQRGRPKLRAAQKRRLGKKPLFERRGEEGYVWPQAGCKKIVEKGTLKTRHGLYYDLKSEKWRSPWYDRETADLRKAQIARELDISYEEAVEALIYGLYNESWHMSEEADRKPESPMYRLWDFGGGDITCCIWCQMVGGVMQVFDAWGAAEAFYETFCSYVAWNRGEVVIEGGVEDAIASAHAQMRRKPREDTRMQQAVVSRDEYEEFLANWSTPGRYPGPCLDIGDPAGKQRHGGSAANTWFLNLQQGVKLGGKAVGAVYMQSAKKHELEKRLQTVKWALKHGRILVHPRAGLVRVALQTYRRHTDAAGRVVPGSPPVHDDSSHPMDALGYGAVYVWGFQDVRIGGGRRI